MTIPRLPVKSLFAALLLAFTVAAHAQSVATLQILLPGEYAAPGTSTGKAGTPRAQRVGVPFEVVVNAVDVSGNIVTSASGAVEIASNARGGDASLPTLALPFSGGTARFTVTFNVTGTYTLTAVDVFNRASPPVSSSPFNVLVADTPDIALVKLPEGLVAPAGMGGATDSYTVVNKGGSPALVSVAQVGVFFNQTPTDFTLQPGQSQTVTVTSNAQPPGVQEGLILIRGNFAPPQLQFTEKLVSAAPAPFTVVQAEFPRIDIDNKETVILVGFRNLGNATATGAIVSSVLWLTPPSGEVVIAPRSVTLVRIGVDRFKRPDVEAGSGSLEGRLDFIYPTPEGTKATAPLTIVYTVPPKNLASSVIAVSPEATIAQVLVGLTSRSGQVADVSVSTPNQLLSSDATLYFVPAGGSTFSARSIGLGRLTPVTPLEFGDALRMLFSPPVESSSVLLKKRAGEDATIGASVIGTTTRGAPVGSFAPFFRAERGAPGGQAIFLTGVRKDSTTRTDLYVQESAKAPASIQIDYFSESGAAIGNPALLQIAELGSIELIDAVPAGAVMARVTNNASSSGRVVAAARVVNDSDLDSIVDGSQQLGYPRTDRLIIPIPRNLSNPALQTDVYITNAGAAQASGELTSTGGPAKRRAVRPGGGAALVAETDGLLSITLGPRQTAVVRSAGAAGTYLEFAPRTGEFVVNSKTYAPFTGSGTSIPAAGVSSALKPEQVRHFVGLEDGSAANINPARTGTYRTAVGLIETAGVATTVRVTVRLTYQAALITTSDAISRDFRVEARQFLELDDIVRAVIGSARDGYGDLHNVAVDVTVIDGGSIIPFVNATENAFGDLMFKYE